MKYAYMHSSIGLSSLWSVICECSNCIFVAVNLSVELHTKCTHRKCLCNTLCLDNCYL